MNWLFWVLLVFTVLSVIRGGRKGFVRTAVSMVSLILVMVIAAWVNPYVGRFLRRKGVKLCSRINCRGGKPLMRKNL